MRYAIKFKGLKFKSLPVRATPALIIKRIRSIIRAANSNTQCKSSDRIIPKKFEQKELSTLSQQKESMFKECGCPCPCPEGTQTHVHEFQGSTKLAEECDDLHNHRFAGVTSQVIPQPGGGHKHALLTNTDFFDNHHHEVGVITGLAIHVGPNGKHVHFADGSTTLDDGHFHGFQFATLIESPLT